MFFCFFCVFLSRTEPQKHRNTEAQKHRMRPTCTTLLALLALLAFLFDSLRMHTVEQQASLSCSDGTAHIAVCPNGRVTCFKETTPLCVVLFNNSMGYRMIENTPCTATCDSAQAQWEEGKCVTTQTSITLQTLDDAIKQTQCQKDIPSLWFKGGYCGFRDSLPVSVVCPKDHCYYSSA